MAFVFLVIASAATAAEATVVVDVRDSATGRAVEAAVRRGDAVAAAGVSRVSPEERNARVTLQLDPGEHRIEIAAERYRPLATALRVEPKSDLSVTVWLDPQAPPEELRPGAVRAKLRAGSVLFHGHVSDAESGEMLRDARVVVRGAAISASTDERGYFAFHVPALDTVDGELPAGDDLLIDVAGYKTHVIENTFLVEGSDTHFIVQMERGSGRTGRRDDHKMWLHRPSGEHPHAEEAHDEPPIVSAAKAAEAMAISVPTSIRVGFDCSCATCSSVQVFSMQTYVKRGLNDEWIASWNAESLKAGSVAYRSFGSWYVEHPRTSTYDICSTTCCQVNDSDTSLATDSAADATIGYVLQKDGAIFRSEYASENNAWDNPSDGKSCSNNDRSCGDGYAGSPANGWPCLSDSICGGQGCFGHGRGMCQWGSQRWASNAKDWKWILNHYYNDEGRPSGMRAAYLYPYEMIVDNATAGRFTASTNWGTSSFSSQRYGADYRFATPQAVSDAAWFKAIVPAAGSYEIYVWYPASTGYNASTPHVIATSSGNQTVTVNQQTNGGAWRSLGIFTLNAGDANLVGVSRWTSGTGYVIADAIKLVSR